MRPLSCCALAAAATLLITVGCQSPASDSHPTPTNDLESSATSLTPLTNTPESATALPQPINLPGATGATIACEANTRRVSLVIPPDQSPASASRLALAGGWLMVVADGGLHRAPEVALDGPAIDLEPVILPGQIIGGRPAQEIADLDVDLVSGRVAALDKAGHVFSFDPVTGETSLALRMGGALEQRRLSSIQFVAVAVDSAGATQLLDSSGAAVWTVTGEGDLRRLAESEALATSVDMTIIGDTVYGLQRGGGLRTLTPDGSFPVWRGGAEATLKLAIKTSMHLGAPLVVTVDGLARTVTGLMPGGEEVTRHQFVLPGMGLLRDALFDEGKLYGLAGNELFVFPAHPDSPPCATPSGTVPAIPDLYGFDVVHSLAGAQWPLIGATLPDAPHAYPGASRAYRLGVHNGTDFYGYGIGTPVMAVAPGVVVDASLDYQGMSYADFQNLTFQAEKLGMTPPDVLSRLEGKKVALYHGNSVMTVYAHLDSIADGIAPGVEVQVGQIIGTVGVTGTSAESRPGTENPHLHFEIWLGDHYLGQGITLRETMWWLEQVFNKDN